MGLGQESSKPKQTQCKPIQAVKCGETLKGLSNGVAGATFAFAMYPCQFLFIDFGTSAEVSFEFHSTKDQEVVVKGKDDGPLYISVLEDMDDDIYDRSLRDCT